MNNNAVFKYFADPSFFFRVLSLSLLEEIRRIFLFLKEKAFGGRKEHTCCHHMRKLAPLSGACYGGRPLEPHSCKDGAMKWATMLEIINLLTLTKSRNHTLVSEPNYCEHFPFGR